MKLLLVLFFSLSSFASNGVYKLDSFEFNSSSKQFNSLKRKIGFPNIIGIGESAHGVEEYLKVKARLIKFYIKNGYRLVLLEQGYIRTDTINKYLNLCHKDQESEEDFKNAFLALNKTEKSIHTLNLFRWMCEFNKNVKVPINYHGIDQWEDPWVTREVIKKGIEKTKNEDYKKYFRLAQKSCFAWDVESWDEASKLPSWDYILQTWRLDPENHRNCVGSIYNMQKVMRKFQGEGFFHINMALKVSFTYQQYRDLYITDTQRALNMRDRLQASLVIDWYEKYNKEKKALLIEHNIHISKAQSQVIPKNPGSLFQWVGVRSTGENLIAHYGDIYKSIALTGYKISSSRDGDYSVLKDKDSLDYFLAKKGDLFFVNPKVKWLRKKKWWMHNENSPMYLIPAIQYDGIIFVKESAPSVQPII